MDLIPVAPDGTASAPVRARRMQPWLGTYVEVAACAGQQGQADRAADAALAAMRAAQSRWSFQDPDSELSALNRAPCRPVPVSGATVRLLRLARAMMVASAGGFDVTLGGLLIEAQLLPDHGGPAWLPRGSADDIAVGAGWARLGRPVRLTLDGIAKGFAVDIAIHAMRRAGANAGWVNAGGDLRAFGDLTVPVSLRQGGGPPAPAGGLRNMAMATSGVPPGCDIDARAFPGRVFGRDSRPWDRGAVTVLARTAWRADALTKVAACTPPGGRAEALRRLGGSLLGARR